MLIIATGVLTLLAVLAFSFVNLMRIERRASTNYMDGFRADMAAEAGMIRALEEMRQYTGSNVVYDPNAEWIYEPDPATNAPRYEVPLADAAKPSLKGDNGATYNGGLDRYRVKVIDTQALIDLNTPNDFPRLMDQLGAAIAKFAGDAGGKNPVKHLKFGDKSGGQAMLDFRQSLDGQRFTSKNQLMELYAAQESYAGGDPVADYKLLQNFVTAHAFRDVLAATPSSGTYLYGSAELERIQGRAPVNLNAASKPVLAAIIAGIGGRVPLVYVAETPTLVDLDFVLGSTTPEIQVEDRYSFRAGWLFIPPIDYTYSVGDTVAYALDENLQVSGKLADMIIEARVQGQGIVSHAHLRKILLEKNISQTVADPFLGSQLNTSIDPSIVNAGVPAGTLYESLYRQGFVDMICSNFNPNWTSAHHGAPNALLVDKAELLRLHEVNNNAVQSARAAMTTEGCFNSLGIFEITALGEVVGEPQGGDFAGLYAQSEIRSVMNIFESKGHTSQDDFLTTYSNFQVERTNVLVRPDDTRYTDFYGISGDLFDKMGSFEIKPEGGKVMDFGVGGNSEPQFFASFDQEAGQARDLFAAEVAISGNQVDDMPAVASYKNAWDVTKPKSFPNTGLRLLDGFYSSEKGNFGGSIKTRAMLRYRAGSAAYNQGSDMNGQGLNYNVGAKKGAIEFWYRTDHDWAVNDQPVPIISGLFHTSHVGPNEAIKKLQGLDELSVGTQMFVTRNYNGQLRVTRLYFESVGPDGNNIPANILYREHGNENPADAQAYAAAAVPPLSSPSNIVSYVWHSQKTNQFWPPSDIIDSGILSAPGKYTHNGHPFRGQWARLEAAVPFEELKHIKADEWHHYVIAWDDTRDDAADAIRIWLDGVEISADKISLGDPSNADELTDPTVQASRKNFKFARLNQEPGEVYDVFNVGCVVREQALANTGVFKFDTDGNSKTVLLAANGTIDDIRSYKAANAWGSGVDPSQYPSGELLYRYNEAVYEHTLDMVDRFTGYTPLHLGVFRWNGHIPEGAEVVVTVNIVNDGGGVQHSYNAVWDDAEDAPGIVIDEDLEYGEHILYRFELYGSRRQDVHGDFSETPVIDDVTVTYFLDAGGDVLIKERVWD